LVEFEKISRDSVVVLELLEFPEGYIPAPYFEDTRMHYFKK